MKQALFHSLPVGLSRPLVQEFSAIHSHYLSHKWLPAELHAGRFCEIVYSVLDGYASGSYPQVPNKPSDFVTACRQLESKITAPRSFKILIPRLLPALFEVRNNRNVGHVGGEVDSNQMDSTMVVCSVNWIMAELIRIYHNVSLSEAQKAVDTMVQYPSPLIWKEGDKRRVLRVHLKIKEQVLALLVAENKPVAQDDLRSWIECDNEKYFLKVLRELHKKFRYIEFDEQTNLVQILPPGLKCISSIFEKEQV